MKEIIVYTTNLCGYCNAAKMWLQNHGLDFKEINLDEGNEREVFMEKYPHLWRGGGSRRHSLFGSSWKSPRESRNAFTLGPEMVSFVDRNWTHFGTANELIWGPNMNPERCNEMRSNEVR